MPRHVDDGSMIGRRVPALAIGCLFFASAAAQATGTYVGSEPCKDCHYDIWSNFRASGHPFTVRSDASTRPLPLPSGYEWSDIGWVVGGRRWKTNYLDTDGYLITKIDPGTANETAGANQYNLATGEWADFHAGEEKKYDCGSCHTTGYLAGAVNPKPGITGTWALEGVQCEACHGAASQHVTSPFAPLNVNPSSALCGGCHSNGVQTKVFAADGFILPHSQYNELLKSPHNNRYCVECHDPHKRSELSFRIECTDCHVHANMAKKKAFKSLGQQHLDRGIGCVECHMPYAAKSAVASNPWKADVRSHLFKITLDPDTEMFKEDGTMATGKLTAGFACLGCHVDVANKWVAEGKPEQAEAWARKNATKIHKD